MRKLFSSTNCSSSVRSSRKVGRKRSNFSRLLIRIFCTAYDLFGFATKTLYLLASVKPCFLSTHLEHVESLVVDHLAVVPQQLHDNLEVFARVDILRHDVVVGPVEQDLPEQLDRLALRDVTFRLNQHRVVLLEEHDKVCLQERCDQGLVLGKNFLEKSACIGT
jgi:hypothetical protein